MRRRVARRLPVAGGDASPAPITSNLWTSPETAELPAKAAASLARDESKALAVPRPVEAVLEPNIAQTRVEPSELLGRIAKGDRDAFQAFYHSYGARVMAMVRRHVATQPLAHELVQEVFVAAWLGARGYREETDDPERWLWGITRHKLQDHWRCMEGLVRAVLAHAESIGVGARIPDPDVRLAVEKGFSGLPAEQRSVLELIYQGGLTPAEAARALCLPIGAVKSRLHSALLVLRTVLSASSW